MRRKVCDVLRGDCSRRCPADSNRAQGHLHSIRHLTEGVVRLCKQWKMYLVLLDQMLRQKAGDRATFPYSVEQTIFQGYSFKVLLELSHVFND